MNNEQPTQQDQVDGETPEQGTVIRVDGDRIEITRLGGPLQIYAVDRPRIKRTCAELQRRAPLLTAQGMQTFATRMDVLFQDLATWADVDTRHMAEQIGVVLGAYKPGVNFKACRKLINAAVVKQWEECLTTIHRVRN